MSSVSRVRCVRSIQEGASALGCEVFSRVSVRRLAGSAGSDPSPSSWTASTVTLRSALKCRRLASTQLTLQARYRASRPSLTLGTVTLLSSRSVPRDATMACCRHRAARQSSARFWPLICSGQTHVTDKHMYSSNISLNSNSAPKPCDLESTPALALSFIPTSETRLHVLDKSQPRGARKPTVRTRCFLHKQSPEGILILDRRGGGAHRIQNEVRLCLLPIERDAHQRYGC